MVEADRRTLLAGVGAALGLGLLPIEALARPGAAPAGPVLDASTKALLAAFADTMIPRTDTPGAVDSGVPRTFGFLLRDWATPEHRKSLLDALGAVDAAAKASTGKPLALLSPSARLTFLAEYDAQQLADVDGATESMKAYLRLKELVVSLYYLSKPGSTVELRYEHVPGIWEASIPLTSATRAWAGANVP